jgi:hypothetical protein
MKKALVSLFLAATLAASARAGAAGLTYHGGPVIVTAKVVFIFWGPGFSNPASPDYIYAHTLQSYRNALGTSPEYNVITQYSGIQTSNLGAGTPDWFDASLPPTNVTDAIARSKINAYLAANGSDPKTIYELVLPSSSYSSSGSVTSCGGPSVGYCSYHNWTTAGPVTVKYSVQPYPSCSACRITGFSDVQDQELFTGQETIDTVTDPTFTGWYNNVNGKEAAELCSGVSPSISSGSFVQFYVWSNAANACVL